MTSQQKKKLKYSPSKPNSQHAGFTLVEMAVVVFLIGILATMGLSALNAQLASANISNTKKKQDIIKDALVAYLGKYNRLPCPDSDLTAPDGIENRGTTGTPTVSANPLLACDKYWGNVPYQTLGLPKSAALDGWDNFFSYQVSNDTPTATAPNLDWTLTNNFHTGNTGVITVKDTNNAELKEIVAVVLSYGQDGLGAYTSKGTPNVLPDNVAQPDQFTNSQNATSRTFYRREYTANQSATGGAFDDILMMLSPNDLLTPLIKEGSMKSPEAKWVQQIADIQNYIVPQLLAKALLTIPECTASISLPPQYKFDPWGNVVSILTITITPTTTLQTFSASAAAMYTLTITPSNPMASQVTAPSASSLFPSLLTNCP
jgi:prepilin-type N-terminal cleavage/methylation domain-containing protein